MFILSFHIFITFSCIRSRDSSFRAVKTCGKVLAKRWDFFLYAVRSRWMWGPRCLLFRSSRPVLPSFLFFFCPPFFLYFFLSPAPSLTLSSWFSLLSPSRKWLESKPRLFLICAVIRNKLCPRPLFTVRIATTIRDASCQCPLFPKTVLYRLQFVSSKPYKHEDLLHAWNILKGQQELLLYIYWTVHHCDSWIKDQLHDVICYFISFLMCSTYFGH